jgi:hypothetical protein
MIISTTIRESDRSVIFSKADKIKRKSEGQKFDFTVATEARILKRNA